MSTGAVAVLLSQQPNTFHGLETIGKIFFLLDVVLFLVFSALISTRFILKPEAFRTSLHHQHESFFFGAFWVSLALILYCIQQYGVPSCGPWLVKTMEVCFWIYAAFALLVSIFQYHVIFDVERLPVAEMMPTWILPIYPVIILGPLAGVILSTQPSSAGTPILIGAIGFQGLGWMFGILIYSLWITRLTISSLPDESKRPGMYVAVGPSGMSLSLSLSLIASVRANNPSQHTQPTPSLLWASKLGISYRLTTSDYQFLLVISGKLSGYLPGYSSGW